MRVLAGRPNAGGIASRREERERHAYLVAHEYDRRSGEGQLPPTLSHTLKLGCPVAEGGRNFRNNSGSRAGSA